MNKPIALFFLLMFLIGTDTFLISPLLPTLTEQFDIAKEYSGWMVGAYALGYAVFALVAGPLSDGLDRRRVMICGMLAFSVTTALCGAATGFASMFAYRFLAGVSTAFVSPQIWAAIPALVKPQQIVRGMGIAMAGLSVSQLLGVPIGSYLASADWRIPFVTVGAAGLLLTLLIPVIVPSLKPEMSPHHLQRSRLKVIGRYRELFATHSARWAFAAYLLYHTGVYGAFAFIGTFLHDAHGLSVGGIGTAMIVIGAGSLLGSVTGSYWVHRFGSRRTFIGAMVLVVADYATLPLWSGLIGGVLAFTFVFYLGGILFPLLMAMLQKLAPQARGTVSSFSNAVMYTGTTIGSYIAGILYVKLDGFAAVSLLSAICFSAALLFFLRSLLFATARAQQEGLPASASGEVSV